MILRRAALLVLLPVLAGGPALAQPASDPTAPIASNSALTDAQIKAWINDAPPPTASDPHDGVVVDKPLPPQIHGEAGITVGSGGYRSVFATAIMPLSNGATLGVAASDTQYGNNRWVRGGNHQSLGLSLAAGDPNASAPPDGCLRVDGRFVEPLWAAQLRGPDDHCSQRHGDDITQPPRP